MNTAFNGGGGGGRPMANGGSSVQPQRQWTTDRQAKRWRVTPAVLGGNSGHQRLMAAMEEGGRWCLKVVIDDCCGSSGQ